VIGPHWRSSVGFWRVLTLLVCLAAIAAIGQVLHDRPGHRRVGNHEALDRRPQTSLSLRPVHRNLIHAVIAA
jgi:hypothetical protein